MKHNGEPVIDRLLVRREIGNHGFEGIGSEMSPQLIEVGVLVATSLLVPGHDKPEQLQPVIVVFFHVLHGFEHMLRAEGSPLGGFEGNEDIIRRTQGRRRDQ